MDPSETVSGESAGIPPARELQRWGIKPVWIASYPRSGNTFLRIVLEEAFGLATYSRYVVAGKSQVEPAGAALDHVVELPVNWRNLLHRTPEARTLLIKTHDAPDDEAPAIYIVRHAGPTIDSYYHYHQNFAFEKPTMAAMIVGACQFGSWSAHYGAWQPQRRRNTLFLRYEDLVEKSTQVIESLAAFLDREPIAGTLPTFAELHAKSPTFFRKGIHSDYPQAWDTSHLSLLNAIHGDTLRELGYPSPEAPLAGIEQLREVAAIAAQTHARFLQRLGKPQ